MNFNNPFSDMFKNTLDFNQLVSAQRRNVEAASTAIQAVVEGAQAITRRQAEVVRDHVESSLKASKDLMTGGSPETNLSKQADFMRESFENALTNLREITEMATKSTFEAFDVLGKRASETMEEVSSITPVKTATKKKAA